jgi:NADH-quinone oxidoreductase subunit F
MVAIGAVELATRRKQAETNWQSKIGADVYITVGMGTCGLAAGANDTLAAIQRELEARELTAEISRVGCVGMCSYEPMIELQAAGKPRVNYGQADSTNVREIFASYFEGAPLRKSVIVGQVAPTIFKRDGHELHSLSFADPASGDQIPFQDKQLRIVLSNCGLIDPESIDDYLALDGYTALEMVLAGMTPEDVIQ